MANWKTLAGFPPWAVFLLLWCFSVSNGALLAGISWVLSSWDNGILSSEWLIIHLCFPQSLSIWQFCFHLWRSQSLNLSSAIATAVVLRMTLTWLLRPQVPRLTLWGDNFCWPQVAESLIWMQGSEPEDPQPSPAFITTATPNCECK